MPPRKYKGQNHVAPPKGKRTPIKVPRKVGSDSKERKKRHRDDSHRAGKSIVHEWKDGTGEMRVGRTVIAIMKGEEDVSKWSDEDLIRGAPKRIARIPHVIPMAVYVELVNRMKAKVQHRFAAELTVAVEEHLKLIKDRTGDIPPSVKLKAIEMIYERVLGKAPEHVVLHGGDENWRKLLANAIVGTDEQAKELESNPQEEVIEGEILDDLEDEEEIA